MSTDLTPEFLLAKNAEDLLEVCNIEADASLSDVGSILRNVLLTQKYLLERERAAPCPDCNDVGEVLVLGDWHRCPNPTCTGRLFAAPLRPALVHDWQGC